jgi:hypothetical protein
MSQVEKIRVELKHNTRTVAELCMYTGLSDSQVRGAIAQIERKYQMFRVRTDLGVSYKLGKRRKVPMKSGVKRHDSRGV